MGIFSKKPKKLTPREAKFFDILSKNPTLSISEAGRQAGFAESTVSGTIYRKLAKARNPLTIALEKAGLTEDKIAKKMVEGLEAYKTVRFNSREGDEHKYVKEHDADFKTRREYLELLGKFRGDLQHNPEVPNKTAISINSVIINNDIDINQAVQIYQDTLNNLDNE